MSLQKIIEMLLRSRLYRTGVAVETETGETVEGLVQELRYDGSRSVVVIAAKDAARVTARIPLSTITRVNPYRPPPRRVA